MTGTNHALTGAVIVTAVSVPLIALPLAFMSHFVLDSLPHFGESYVNRKKISKIIWTIDLVFLFLFLAGLTVTGNWLLLTGALLAISPDLAWIYRFIVDEKFGKLHPKPTNRFNSFHISIQKYESKRGIFVEIAWFVIFIIILIKIT